MLRVVGRRDDDADQPFCADREVVAEERLAVLPDIP
jgi:hypothetical protein